MSEFDDTRATGALRVVAIVQARMGSTRLPGKVLLDLAGKTVLGRVVERLRRVAAITAVVVATTDSVRDDAITDECRRESVAVFRGSEDDVLDRYYQVANWSGADVIVRITADCPLIDPEVTGETIDAFLSTRCDYASNFLQRMYPRGLDTEVFTARALSQAWREASQAYQRAHVTPYIYQHPELFQLTSVSGSADYSHHRWTIDVREDYELIRSLYDRVAGKIDFGWRDVLGILQREPQLVELNRNVSQKPLHLG